MAAGHEHAEQAQDVAGEGERGRRLAEDGQPTRIASGGARYVIEPMRRGG